MTRSYRRFALAAILLLTLHQTLGELQRAATRGVNLRQGLRKGTERTNARSGYGHSWPVDSSTMRRCIKTVAQLNGRLLTLAAPIIHDHGLRRLPEVDGRCLSTYN
uniref:Secreted protein n=1 Tax=Anopheles merus TaxID=30066 RepID=A0A182V034_ANOME